MNLILPKDYMNNLATTTNSNLMPLTNERKKTPAPGVVNDQEQIEGIDRAGWFESDSIEKGFDATIGSINNFNPDKVVSDSVASEIFGGSDQWVSIKPLDVANKAATAVSTTANLVGNAASAGKDAGIDLFNQIIGKDQTPETQKPLTPEEQKKEEELAEYNAKRQAEDDINAQITSIRNKIDAAAQLAVTRENISDLTGIQKWLEGMVDEKTGEVRTDLKTSAEQKSKELREKQLQATEPLKSPSKHGAEGPGMSMDDNKSGETHTTAQTATG